MKTIKSFEQDKYLSKLQSKILEVYNSPENYPGAKFPKEDNIVLLVLEETVFFPGGGGQSCDLGTINGIPVVNVFEDNDEIYHQLDVSESGAAFTSGETCEMEIDWPRRFDNMQRHCGEHILSGVCYDLWGGVNRGFHMGDDYMTIDISLEDKPEYKEVTWDMAMDAEMATNEIIQKDLPVIYNHFDTKAEAEKLPLRKALAIESDITIVTIGDGNKPADSVACCGTHPSSSGQVGLLKIYKVEPNKGMYRLYFEAGKRALEGYRDRFEVLTKLEKDLSAGFPDLLEKYRAKQDKQKEVRDRLYKLTKEVQKREEERILIGFDAADTPNITLEEYSILTIDDLIEMGRNLEGKIKGILFLLHSPSNTLLLFSDDKDCGKLVKDNVEVFNGKGGGNSKFARSIFSRPEDAQVFMDAIDKLTR